MSSRTPSTSVLGFIVEEFRPLRWIILFSLLTTAANAVIEVVLIAYAGRLVDDLATAHGVPWGSLSVAALLVLVGRPLLAFAGEATDDIVYRPRAQYLARLRLHRYVSRQSVGWFRDDQAGRIASWVKDGGQSAADACYSVIHTVVAVTAYVAGSIFLMTSMDVRLVVPLLAWLLLYALFMAWIVPRFRRASALRQAAESALTGFLVDSYGNADTLALLGDFPDDAPFVEARKAHTRVQRLEVAMNTTMTALGSLLMVGLIGFGIVLWHSGAAPIGLIASALALSFQITSMGGWLLDAVSAVFGAVGALRQSLDKIAVPLAVPDRPGACDLHVRGGEIVFSAVTHTYGRGAGGLDRLSLRVAPGEKVGLVGRSGAGKSTTVGLLLRFFDAESGSITVDGQDIRSVTQASLRSRIALVSQDASLLHRSVRDNIAPGGDLASIEAAASRAAASFVPSLRDASGRAGFEAFVGERGVRLSGGQRQRIALARALHKDAPILILDEATSALDSEVEAAIHDTLDEVMQGRTVIAIAHRLSTIARMDRIVVLDEGRVAEEGTHASLIARGGLYASLWERQAGGFLGLAADPVPTAGTP